MIFIHNEKSDIQRILAPVQKNRQKLKWSNYVLLLGVDEGTLAWNTLTSVLVLLENVSAEVAQSDPESLSEVEQLYNASFLVPEEMDEYKRLNELDLVLARLKKPIEKNGFTILTTLNCNARCKYCYEKGVVKKAMSEKTAIDVAEFIIKNGRKVNIRWFGGEPLVNIKTIDLISSELRKSGLEFKSDMVSNGYLFDEEIIRRAVDFWNLKKVQITLDGTEDIYNKTKAYVSAKGSPYKKVLDNIDLLLTAGIAVSVRLNLSLDNASDLLILADELPERFGSQKKFSVYAHLLFEYDENTPEAQQNELIDAYEKLIKKLYELRLYKMKLPESLSLNHCMADSDNSYTILPNGKIGKCEHFSDSNFVGDIWNGVTDETLVAKFKEREMHERCKECLFAPSCTLLKMCPANCNDLYIATKKIDLEQSMLAAYRKWKEENKEKEYETEK